MSVRRAAQRTREEDLALRIAALGSALFWAGIFFGVVDLTVPFDAAPSFYRAYMLETGWGVLYTFLVAAAFVALVVAPDLVVPLLQIAAASGAVALTALVSGSLLQLLPGVLLALNAFAYAWLAHGELRLRTLVDWQQLRPDPIVGALAMLVALPALVFAGDMIAGYWQGRPPTDDETFYIDHWPTQGALAVSVTLTALAVAAGVRQRWRGTAASTVCLVVATAWFGVASTTYPDHAGSAGEFPGRLLTGWAAVFAVVVAWRHLAGRRRPT